jgi:hypothetical protein
LITSSSDVDLSRGLTDGAFLAYDKAEQKFVLNYVDTFAEGAIDPRIPGSDFHVPSTLNVQNYVSEVADGLEQQIIAIQTGIRHRAAVLDVLKAPPATPPDEGDRYIVDKAPTAGTPWETHKNQVAEWTAGAWVYADPLQGDAHRVINQDYTLIWDGADWIKLDRQARVSYQKDAPTNPVKGDIWVDDSLLASARKMLISYFDGATWVDSSGSRTWVQPTDPAKDPKTAALVHDGDIWIDTSPIGP